MTEHDSPDAPASGLPRRRLFQSAAGGVALGALGVGGAWGMRAATGDTVVADKDGIDLTTQHPFYDEVHPAGVQTPPQRYCIFMTFDMTAGTTATDLQ